MEILLENSIPCQKRKINLQKKSTVIFRDTYKENLVSIFRAYQQQQPQKTWYSARELAFLPSAMIQLQNFGRIPFKKIQSISKRRR
jgi:hypothetical protein